MDAPGPQMQIDFLQRIQRLLEEGTFTATYKFALLLALADLCVERGDDTGDPFRIETTWLAEKFIAYYWRQTRPYVRPSSEVLATSAAMLRQNAGRPAVILTALKTLDSQGWSLSDVQRSNRHWPNVVEKVRRVIVQMPLWKLQVVGHSPDEFLYRHGGNGVSIELEPGVVFCFRRFHGLISDLVRGAWVRYIRRHNQDALGSPTDLDQFLFGSERVSLAAYLPILREVQQARCFYCGREIVGNAEQSHVDHFIPWSRYPVDLGHNFVLAHGRCNLAKADHLAATEHLEHWVERNRCAGAFLAENFTRGKIVHDLSSSTQITRWAYEHAAAVKAPTWTKGRQLQSLGPDWFRLLDDKTV